MACLFALNPPASHRKAAYLPYQIDCTNTGVLFCHGHLIVIREMSGMIQWWFKECKPSQSAVAAFAKGKEKPSMSSLVGFLYIFLLGIKIQINSYSSPSYSSRETSYTALEILIWVIPKNFSNAEMLTFWRQKVFTWQQRYKTITRCGLNPQEVSLWVSNKWADNKMTQLSICHSINKMFDLLHLLCEWRRSGKSPLVNPQSFCSSALTRIYRFVWVFRSAAWVSKFILIRI